jgi:allophanate hydrolase subunit 2
MTPVRAANWSNLDRGMPVGGPFDIEAAEAANRAVGNAPDADLLEFAQVGPRVTPDSSVMMAWCDAGGCKVYRARRDETIDIGRIRNGLRGYLAIGERGQVPELKRDDRLVIRAMSGPHDIGLGEIECEVTPSLDRVGIRMRPLRKIDTKPPADLPSIGMQFGSVQLHPDGSLVAMGPDHPVTGGYLQPMTVITSERWKLGQLMPGETVTLRVN